MSEQITTDRHFVAELSNEEYIQVRVLVAMRCIKLKDWITEAVREKLEREEKE